MTARVLYPGNGNEAIEFNNRPQADDGISRFVPVLLLTTDLMS